MGKLSLFERILKNCFIFVNVPTSAPNKGERERNKKSCPSQHISKFRNGIDKEVRISETISYILLRKHTFGHSTKDQTTASVWDKYIVVFICVRLIIREIKFRKLGFYKWYSLLTYTNFDNKQHIFFLCLLSRPFMSLHDSVGHEKKSSPYWFTISLIY